jgi:uncharacterized protein YjbJ (UPF0337 family)
MIAPFGSMMPQERNQDDDRNGNSNQPKQHSSSESHVDVLRLACARAGSRTNVCRTKAFRPAVAAGLSASEASDDVFRNRGAEAPFIRCVKEVIMDWNRVSGNWKQVKGAVKQQWGKLTDDDLTEIDGRRETLEGVIQERYGIAMDETRKQIDAWYQSQGWQ